MATPNTRKDVQQLFEQLTKLLTAGQAFCAEHALLEWHVVLSQETAHSSGKETTLSIQHLNNEHDDHYKKWRADIHLRVLPHIGGTWTCEIYPSRDAAFDGLRAWLRAWVENP